ncbi:MAG: helix-turn-helix transcriptional regulator [Myxococcales bacterium]|nr:helix-turn-helix transcriptional regulator [Myxococcales bacterium]
MTADDVKALRKHLGVTARDLAAALGIEQEEVLAWERGDRFPTKKFVDEMERIRNEGPAAVPKRSRKGASPLEVLSDPALWSAFRKMLVHETLRKEVLRLADRYDEPTV